MIADAEIESLLHSFHLPNLHTSADTIYALRSDLRLVYVNQGWQQFASQNGADDAFASRWPLGTSIQEAIPEILRPFFQDHFAKCLATGCPWQHRYECSSPDMFREFLMTAYPLGEQQGFLVVHSLIHQSAHQRIKHVAEEGRYCDENHLITQCVHCRRIRRPDAKLTWDWVPEWVASWPSNTSHGFCDSCYGFYYPGGRFSSKGYPNVFRTGE